MSDLAKTIVAAVIVFILAAICLGIGFLISGKNRLRKRCGMRPKDDANSSTCPLCGGGEPCEEKKDEHNDTDTEKNVPDRGDRE